MEVDSGHRESVTVGVLTEDQHEGCRTPRRGASSIQATAACPPAPRKKRVYAVKRDPPTKGYFQPPDLEVLFNFKVPSAMRREACAWVVIILELRGNVLKKKKGIEMLRFSFCKLRAVVCNFFFFFFFLTDQKKVYA